MISKNQIKYIRSLETKKGRSKNRTFAAEGPKVVADLMALMQPQMIVATQEWYERNPSVRVEEGNVVVTEDELRKVSFLQHPQQVIAVFPMRGGGGHVVDDHYPYCRLVWHHAHLLQS